MQAFQLVAPQQPPELREVPVHEPGQVPRVSQILLIMFRLPPRRRERPGFLAGWPAPGMGREIWRR